MTTLPPKGANASGALPGDRIIIWPILATIAVPLAWTIIVGFFPLLLFGLVLLGVWYGLPLAAALGGTALLLGIAAVRSLRRGAWRRAISYAVPPLAILVVALNAGAFANLCREVGDRAHFYLMRPRYLAEVATRSSDGQPLLLVWNWGGMLWSSTGVVYDESDEIALPPDRQSEQWKKRAEKSELACAGGYSVEPMGDHFYLAGFPC